MPNNFKNKFGERKLFTTIAV